MRTQSAAFYGRAELVHALAERVLRERLITFIGPFDWRADGLISREDKKLTQRTTARQDFAGLLVGIENTGLAHVPREHQRGLAQFQTCDRLLLVVDQFEDLFTNVHFTGSLP